MTTSAEAFGWLDRAAATLFAWCRAIVLVGLIAVPCIPIHATQFTRIGALVSLFWLLMWRISLCAEFTSWRTWLRELNLIVGGWGKLLAALLIAVVLVPQYSCYTDRVRMSEVLSLASPLKSEIGERALHQGSLRGSGSGLSSFAPAPTIHLDPRPDGMIVGARDDKVRGLFLLIPSMPPEKPGEVIWTCYGWPHRVVPSQCRQPL